MAKSRPQTRRQNPAVQWVLRAVPKYSQSMACEAPLESSRLDASTDNSASASDIEDIGDDVSA